MIAILGSSRESGNTAQALQLALGSYDIPIVNLSKLDISHYDYDHKNENDDFIPLAEKMIEHNAIILATPVYWYTMSARMKIFIDRWSDLTTIRKDIGRKLAGKWVYVVTTYGNEFPTGFEDAFRLTCCYLNMHYGGCYFHYSGEEQKLLAQNELNARSFQMLIEEHIVS